MDVLAAIGGGAFVLASLVLGLRLMALARRTRGLPEFILGFALFAMGGLGYPLLAVAMQATGLPPATRTALAVVQMLLSGVGMVSIACFTWRVFRPTSRWASMLVGGVGGAYGLAFAVQGLGPGFFAFLLDPAGPWHVSTFFGIGVMGWAGAESLRYHRMLRKRIGLGLADPVVADRFRLWAIAILVACTISVVSVVLERVFGIPVAGSAAGALAVGPLGLVAAGTLWLAFLPPAAYVARVRARASA